MKSTELRIGNIIESRTKHPVKANWGTLKALENGEKTYFPIQLTEEWILKFGFKGSVNTNIYAIFSEVSNEINENYDVVFKIIRTPDLFNNSITKSYRYENTYIKYVHQLQNIYFALTGNELQCEGF